MNNRILLIAALLITVAAVALAQDDSMSVEEANKALIEEYLATMSGQEKTLDMIMEYVSEEDALLAEHILGAESILPEYEIMPVEMVAEGDVVMVRLFTRGVHEGEFLGISPTGNTIEFEAAIRYTIRDGLIVDHWLLSNDLAIVQQMGATISTAGAEMTVEEENLAVVNAYLDAVNGQVKTRELLEQYIEDEVLIGHILSGEAGVPAYGFEPMEVYADGDAVIVRAVFSGTHEGEYLGVPATGNELEGGIMIRFTLEDGKIVDHFMMPDALTVLQQMGMQLANADGRTAAE